MVFGQNSPTYKETTKTIFKIFNYKQTRVQCNFGVSSTDNIELRFNCGINDIVLYVSAYNNDTSKTCNIIQRVYRETRINSPDNIPMQFQCNPFNDCINYNDTWSTI